MVSLVIPEPDSVEGLRVALQLERQEHAHTLRMLATKHEDLIELREKFWKLKGRRSEAAKLRRKQKQDAGKGG